jgi:hypothetical protein
MKRPSESPVPHDVVPHDGVQHDRVKAQRRGRAVGAALVGGLVVAAAAGLAVAGTGVPAPASLAAGTARPALVPAGDASRGCSGPARLLEGTPVQGDPQFSPASKTARTDVSAVVLSDTQGVLPEASLAGADGTVVRPLPGGALPAGTAAQPRAAVVPGQSISGAAVLTARANGGTAPSVAGLTRFSAADGDLRGLATATCTAPSNDQWLLGAATTVGRTSVLTLTNASATPATVDFEFFGDKALTQAPPSSRGLQIKPGSTASYVLSGYVPGQANLSVHVRSTGGPVSAAIQQSTLRGLTPGGVELITAAAAPSVRQTVAGIDLQDPEKAKQLAARQGYADAGAALALTVPGAADAVVQLRAYGRNGPVALPGGGVVTAKAGTVTEVSLAGLPAGTYSVSATSDVSFTAAARVPRGLSSTEPLDFASPGASLRLASDHVLAVGKGMARRVVVGVPDGRAQIRAVPVAEDGRLHPALTLDVAGGTTAILDVPEESEGSPVAALVLSASGDPAYSTLVTTGDGNGIAAAAVTAPASGAQALPVTLGY